HRLLPGARAVQAVLHHRGQLVPLPVRAERRPRPRQLRTADPRPANAGGHDRRDPPVTVPGGTPPPGSRPLAEDTVGPPAGLTSTRAIRRYRDEAVPLWVLRDILFAATRAPSGSNRQPFRFLVLTDGPRALQARRLIGDSARRLWSAKSE